MTYVSEEHTNRCFNELINKGYPAAIIMVGILFDRELGSLKDMQGSISMPSYYRAAPDR